MLRVIVIIGVMLFLLLPAGCGGGEGEIQASLDSEFILSIGQSARIGSEDLSIKFVEVIGDSRCPEGVVCIWEGEVSCLIDIDYGGTVLQKTLVQRGSPGSSESDFSDYRLRFGVNPYPKVGEQIKDSEYRLHMTVNKKPVLTGGILATFEVVGESYSIFITNGQTIAFNGRSRPRLPGRHGAEVLPLAG